VSAVRDTRDAARMVRCPLCGGWFPGRDACVAGCPLAGSCRTLCCPHCHYRFVEESTIARWVGRLLHGARP
jgi:hypothetical protein